MRRAELRAHNAAKIDKIMAGRVMGELTDKEQKEVARLGLEVIVVAELGGKLITPITTPTP